MIYVLENEPRHQFSRIKKKIFFVLCEWKKWRKCDHVGWVFVAAKTGDKKSWPLEKMKKKIRLCTKYTNLSFFFFFKLTDVHFVVIYLRSLNLCIKSRFESHWCNFTLKRDCIQKSTSHISAGDLMRFFCWFWKPRALGQLHVYICFLTIQYESTSINNVCMIILSSSFLTFSPVLTSR